ncbi:MAG: (2Fe-2S)-binding protein [Pseudomonadota bacterium]
MFKRNELDQSEPRKTISFTWEGRQRAGEEGDTVAAALLSNGVRASREHPVTGERRAPFCMMGTCFECLVEIDGIPNQQACQVRLREGMQIRRQQGARS